MVYTVQPLFHSPWFFLGFRPSLCPLSLLYNHLLVSLLLPLFSIDESCSHCYSPVTTVISPQHTHPHTLTPVCVPCLHTPADIMAASVAINDSISTNISGQTTHAHIHSKLSAPIFYTLCPNSARRQLPLTFQSRTSCHECKINKLG